MARLLIEMVEKRGFRALIPAIRQPLRVVCALHGRTQWVVGSAAMKFARTSSSRSRMAGIDCKLRRPSAARRRVIIASEHRGHPDHGYMGWDW